MKVYKKKFVLVLSRGEARTLRIILEDASTQCSIICDDVVSKLLDALDNA